MRVLVVDAFLPTKRGRDASAVFVDRVRAVLNPLDVQVRVLRGMLARICKTMMESISSNADSFYCSKFCMLLCVEWS
jgi:hypothetical protein